MNRMFGSAMGELTVVREGEGWIVLEDGRRVGGTLRYPFATRQEAHEWVERELAAEARRMATGNVTLSETARVIRETDAKLWAKLEQIEEELVSEDDDTKEAAHRAAGTFDVLIEVISRLALADLEADGRICRTGELCDGETFFARKH